MYFENFINEHFGYEDIFGTKYSHEEVLETRIKNALVSIICEELSISEKDFNRIDRTIAFVDSVCKMNSEIYEYAQQYYEENKRLNLYAEIAYEKFIGFMGFENVFLNEQESKDIKGKKQDPILQIQRSRKLSKELKQKILNIATSQTRYKNGIVFQLSGWNDSVKGCSLGADKNGFFCYTHRARSKSYKEPDLIPKSAIKFIESTG